MLILSLIGKIVKMFLELLALVVRKTGLAASAIFAVLFTIVWAVWLRNSMEADTFLLVLTLVSVVLFIVTWGLRMFKKDKRDREKEKAKVNKREVKREKDEEDEDEFDDEQEERRGKRVKRVRDEDIEYYPSYRERTRYNYDDDYSDLDTKYNIEGNAKHPELNSGRYYDENDLQKLGSGGQVSNHNEKQERPMLFRTRIADDILIHEYSDRLEFYREHENGYLELVEIRRK